MNFFLYFKMLLNEPCNCEETKVITTSFIHFPIISNLEHRARFGVSVITHTIRHMVGLLWTSDQPVANYYINVIIHMPVINF
jgi:hypothetical protein